MYQWNTDQQQAGVQRGNVGGQESVNIVTTITPAHPHDSLVLNTRQMRIMYFLYHPYYR